jgi:hypothetical protein
VEIVTNKSCEVHVILKLTHNEIRFTIIQSLKKINIEFKSMNTNTLVHKHKIVIKLYYLDKFGRECFIENYMTRKKDKYRQEYKEEPGKNG